MAVAVVGASLFIFLVKGGTVAVLVRGERDGGRRSRSRRCSFAVVAHGRGFSVERFIEAPRALFPRYVRLGVVLMAVYALSGLGAV